MKFSVIIPVYNAEKYFNKCVDSILSQTFADFELILVDDSSPDRCPEICDEYAQLDGRVKVIHKANGGAADARNEGIRIAVGEYLVFVDSDDYWVSNDVLEKINGHINKYNSEAVQFGFYKLFSDSSEPVICNAGTFDNEYIINESVYLSSVVQNRKLTPSACRMAVLRKLVIDNNLMFPKGVRCEDIEWAFRLFVLKPKMTFMSDAFYVYRYNREGSVTNTIDYKHLINYCDIIDSSIKLIEDKNDVSLDAIMSYAMQHIILATAHNQRINLPKAQKKEINKRLKASAKNRMDRYTLDRRVKMMLPIYKLFGFNIMSFALGIYLKQKLD